MDILIRKNKRVQGERLNLEQLETPAVGNKIRNTNIMSTSKNLTSTVKTFDETTSLVHTELVVEEV
jgi:hypothetical protein